MGGRHLYGRTCNCTPFLTTSYASALPAVWQAEHVCMNESGAAASLFGVAVGHVYARTTWRCKKSKCQALPPYFSTACLMLIPMWSLPHNPVWVWLSQAASEQPAQSNSSQVGLGRTLIYNLIYLRLNCVSFSTWHALVSHQLTQA